MKPILTTCKSYEGSDERYTRAEAIIPIVKFLPKEKVIWCPCDTEDSKFVKIFKENNLNVIYSHISYGQDFYTYEPSKWDILITNPPFANKTDFIKRVLSFRKPFALLLPLTWLNDTISYKLFKDIDLQLVIFDKRTQYDNTPQEKQNIPFKSGYYADRIFNKQITFLELYRGGSLF